MALRSILHLQGAFIVMCTSLQSIPWVFNPTALDEGISLNHMQKYCVISFVAGVLT